jgi:cell division transport system permease protein
MLKVWTKLDYLLGETFLGIKRGGWMNWAAISTVAVLLFLLGVGLQASWQLESLLSQMGNQLEISVYVNGDGRSIQPQIEGLSNVSAVRFIPKEEAWQSLVKELGKVELGTATQQLGGNPLLDEFKIRTTDPSQVAAVAEQLKSVPGVEDIWFTSEVVDRVGQLRKGLTQAGFMVVGMLTTVAIAVINTTIRLIVTARRREIEIMQLVGATSTWIYFPFVLQGIFFGLAGAVIAYLLQRICIGLIADIWLNQPELIRSLADGLGADWRTHLILPFSLLIFGVTLGILGSLLAVRKFSLR